MPLIYVAIGIIYTIAGVHLMGWLCETFPATFEEFAGELKGDLESIIRGWVLILLWPYLVPTIAWLGQEERAGQEADRADA